MSALPLPLQLALRGVIPPQTDDDTIARLTERNRALSASLSKLRTDYELLLRLPFQFEYESRPAVTHLAPEDCSEAEYALRTADEAVVHDAVDWLIDKYMPELEAKVSELQDRADREDRA